MFSGNLDSLNLGDVLRLIGSKGSTGVLRIFNEYSETPGSIYIIDGKPVDAECGAENGLSALYALFGWLDGEFEFSKEKVQKNIVIKKGVKEIVSEAKKMLADGSLSSITKKERLTLTRERNKLDKVLGGIANLNRLPSAIFIVDIQFEHIAISEANKLGIRTFGMVDTNSNPNMVDFPVPSNDDASKSISLITNYLTSAIKDGLEERKSQKIDKGEMESVS